LADGGVDDVRIVVPRETAPGERRVALVPESCKKLIQAGYEISIEAGAAEAAGFSVMRSEENERARIGRELHDSTSQYLVAADLGLGVERQPRGDAEAGCQNNQSRKDPEILSNLWAYF